MKKKKSTPRKKKTSTKKTSKAVLSNNTIKFGTDGWRGKMSEDYTFDNVRRCAQGFANYLKKSVKAKELKRGVVIGGDKRFNSEHFAAAAAEVLSANGIPVHYCGGGVPTPVISFSVKQRNALAAINITASAALNYLWLGLLVIAAILSVITAIKYLARKPAQA